MKAKDLNERATQDLIELREMMTKELFGNRMKNFTNQLDDTSQLRKARRDIARINMILSERGRGRDATPAETGGSES